MMAQKVNNITDDGNTEKSTSSNTSGAFVKVSMDGAPYLRKVDLTMYKTLMP
jgi:auxin-responsive protein IAA